MAEDQDEASAHLQASEGDVEGGQPLSDEEPETPGGATAADPDFHHFVELWNDYDPSMRFVAIFPVGEEQGATESSVAYYIVEPGRHTGLHSDNVEEVVFIAEGEGEAFSLGATRRLEAGRFIVFPAGVEHDIYASGGVALRLLSFFPTREILTRFQQAIFPVGGNLLSSRPPRPVVTELDPNELPPDFPFDLAELGIELGELDESSAATDDPTADPPPSATPEGGAPG